MKRYLGCMVVAAAILVLPAVPLANARTGGSGGPGHQGSPNHWGGDHGGGFHNGGHFGHDHFRGHSDFFFGFGYPFGYPYYGGPYYYYDYPPYYYYDDYYAPRYYYDYGPSVNYYSSQAPAYRVDDSRSYLTLGHDSGKGLKKKDVTWNWFIEYLQAYIVNAPPWARDDFHRGFVSGYGDNAEAIYRKGIQQAQQPRPASNENAPASEPGSNTKQN
jgi:hypothetical protein